LHASAPNGTLGGTEKLSSGEASVSVDQPDSKIMHIQLSNKGDEIAKSSLMLDSASKKSGPEELLHQTSVLPERESSDEPETIELNSKIVGLKLGDEFKENDTSSILEKIFGNSLAINVSNSVDSTEVIVAVFCFSFFLLFAILISCYFQPLT
jgi:hypothetical protein